MSKISKIIIPIISAVLAVAITLIVVFRVDIFGNGIENINENTYGDVAPGGRFMFVF